MSEVDDDEYDYKQGNYGYVDKDEHNCAVRPFWTTHEVNDGRVRGHFTLSMTKLQSFIICNIKYMSYLIPAKLCNLSIWLGTQLNNPTYPTYHLLNLQV